jgi:hypothetical protein
MQRLYLCYGNSGTTMDGAVGGSAVCIFLQFCWSFFCLFVCFIVVCMFFFFLRNPPRILRKWSRSVKYVIPQDIPQQLKVLLSLQQPVNGFSA